MDLAKVFYPKSIAVIGASRKPKTVGNDIVKNLTTQGYDGIIYPINPRAEALYGHKVYASTKEIKEAIDLVIVCVPACAVAGVIEEAALHNQTKAAIVISAGCKEVGCAVLEDQLRQVCQKHQIALIGPNCLGVINPEIRMNASFANQMPGYGNVAFISQSGALCTSILDYANHLNIGFSKFLSIGNKAQTNEKLLLEYFAQDDKTKVIAMYIEDLVNAQEFIQTAIKITKGKNPKPIIVLKSGRTSEGASAVASHTGSLASADSAYQALFDQAGIIRANTIRELLEYIDIFSQNKNVPVKNVAIVTNAGGPGVLSTDEVVSQGLNLAKPKPATKKALDQVLPPAASTKNPIDILGDAKAERYEAVLKPLIKDPNVDAVLTLLTPQSMTEPELSADALIQIKHSTDKPVVASFMGQSSVASSVFKMEKSGVSTTAFPELAVRGLAQLGKFYSWSNSQPDSNFKKFKVDNQNVTKVFNTGESQFPEAKALKILADYGIQKLHSEIASSAKVAQEVAQKIGHKVALKIVSPQILHKSDVGGVMLGIEPNKVAKAYEQIIQTVSKNCPTATIEGVLVMQMAPAGGLETIVGVKKDPQLGHMIMFGLGGIYVEVLKDVSFGFAPLTHDYAAKMIESLKTSALFNGVRGELAKDVPAIVEVLGRISQLVIDFPEIEELDINPLLVLPKGQGVLALDARIILETKD